jgi:glycosidase
VIYYGDEIGDPGANDPDNRRMMRFENLLQEEMNVKSVVERLTKLRAQSMPLLYGDTEIVACTDSYLAYVRHYFNEDVLVVFNKSRQGDKISFTLPDYVKLKNPKTMLGHKVDVKGREVTLEMTAVSFEVVY